ncbi:MAG TPA: hypothetical protein VIV60_19265, partial [Polyangiaceae bacterium]
MSKLCPTFANGDQPMPHLTHAVPQIHRNPFAQRAATKTQPATEPQFTYLMYKTGPDVNPEEVELPNVAAVEVMVLWGQNVLHVAHLRAGEGFTVGEEQGKHTACDFFIPAEKLGTTRLPLVVADLGGTSVTIPTNARGRVERKGQNTVPFEEMRGQGTLATPTIDGHRMPLRQGTNVVIEIADFVIRIAAVNAGKPSKRGLAAGVEWEVFSYF